MWGDRKLQRSSRARNLSIIFHGLLARVHPAQDAATPTAPHTYKLGRTPGSGATHPWTVSQTSISKRCRIADSAGNYEREHLSLLASRHWWPESPMQVETCGPCHRPALEGSETPSDQRLPDLQAARYQRTLLRQISHDYEPWRTSSAALAGDNLGEEYRAGTTSRSYIFSIIA